ncbi:MAG: carboxypeptidase regulatory-like domain-containing protein [Alistipes sp.]|nr:carboxypeptidase regulatory-like domain-containing protein [Alistipes sp.]
MKRLLLTVALSLVVAVAMAQVTTSSIRGEVTANDNPLSGATIVAIHTPSGTRYGTISNNEGHYAISGMRVGGPYEVTISFIGYNNVIYKDINLGIGDTQTLNAKLQESSVELGDVVITAQVNNGGGKTFSRSDMEQIPSIDRSI